MQAKEILAKSKTEAQQLSSSQQSILTAIVSNKPLPTDTPSLSNPYETARSKRVSPLPYPTGSSRNPQSSKPKAPTTSKGAIPLSNPPGKVIVQCGFEVRAGGKFHTKLSELQGPHWIEVDNPNSYKLLQDKLQHKFKGTELNKYGTFDEEHFPFAKLGTKKSGVEEQLSFFSHLENNKYIDLIFNYNAYEKKSLKEEENDATESVSDIQTIPSFPSLNRNNTNSIVRDVPLDSSVSITVDSIPRTLPDGDTSQDVPISSIRLNKRANSQSFFSKENTPGLAPSNSLISTQSYSFHKLPLKSGTQKSPPCNSYIIMKTKI
jgi:hypothetical protein